MTTRTLARRLAAIEALTVTDENEARRLAAMLSWWQEATGNPVDPEAAARRLAASGWTVGRILTEAAAGQAATDLPAADQPNLEDNHMEDVNASESFHR